MKIELDKIEAELNYYRVEYETKLYENIIFSINHCLNIFIDYLKKNEFIIETEGLFCKATSPDTQFNFKPRYDYRKDPRKVRIIDIQRIDFGLDKKADYQIGIFSDEPLPQGDWSRLSKNPTKGMSADEIKLLEMQKSLKYFKEFISKDESDKYWVFQAGNLTEEKDFGYEKDIRNHYKKMIP